MSRAASLLAILLTAPALAGQPLRETPDPRAVYDVRADVTIEGTVRTHAGQGQETTMPLKASALFRFDEKPLDAAADPAVRRALRVYRDAKAQTLVGEHRVTTTLPEALRRVVVAGRTDGPVRFSLDGLMTREAVDLLDMPGDPLAVTAAMPDGSVEVGGSFRVPEWAAQMLCGMDVLTKSTLAGRLTSPGVVTLSGSIEGARLGAAVTTNVSGNVRVDPSGRMTGADLRYEESAAIGTISPGVDAVTTVRLTRTPSRATVDDSGVPPTVPPAALKLYLDAPSWGVRLLHDRDWHVFYASPDGEPAVLILRLLENGKLLSQVNVAKLRPAAAGRGASVEEFEADIKQSLGTRFGTIVDKAQRRRDDGVVVTRVVAAGQFHYTEGTGEAKQMKSRPMQWTYYLAVHPDGRQLSCVFAHEPDARDRLAGRDESLVDAIEFFAPRVAAAN